MAKKDQSTNEKILEGILAARIDLLRYSESVREKVIALLEDLQDDIERELRLAALPAIPNPTLRIRRLELLRKEVNETIATAYRKAGTTLSDEFVDLAEIQRDTSLAVINNTVKVTLAETTLTRADLRELVSESMIQGAPQKEWWSKQSRDLQHRFLTQVRMGLAQGEDNEQIVRRLIGSASGTRRVIRDAEGKPRVIYQRSGGVMSVSKREATALVRTAVQTVSNNVLDKTYDENADIIKGRMLVVTLDGRTSPLCRGRAGARWDNDGNPMKESPWPHPYPGPPPYHFNCRSVIVPILKSWDELAGMKGIAEPGLAERASMDGQVPAGNLTYEEWFKTKSETFQREVLGDARYRLWKNDGITMAEMVDPSGRPLTLDELRAKVKP